ncbi:MAG: peptidoglycan-associated lipoprotein Pal [Syntrophobacteraceae bacterium]
MKKKQSIFLVLMMFAFIAAMGACSKKNVPPPPGYGGAGQEIGAPAGGPMMDEAKWRELGINSEAEKREFLDKAKAFENQDVYFDYDAYTLTEPAKKVLDEKIAFLKRYPRVAVTIEGHCDERGTTEYNIALGERRAHAAREYITNSNSSNLKLTTVSYGKERPIAVGHDEASWAKNRRDHFVLNY